MFYCAKEYTFFVIYKLFRNILYFTYQSKKIYFIYLHISYKSSIFAPSYMTNFIWIKWG